MKLSPYFDTTTQLIKMNPRTGEEPLILPPRRSSLTHLVIDDCHEVYLCMLEDTLPFLKSAETSGSREE